MDNQQNQAILSAHETRLEIEDCITNGSSFKVEAGAGAGKTYSLIETLHYILNTKKNLLRKNNQKIACITYTNVAVNEIRNRIGDNSNIWVSTLHNFCWENIKQFHSELIQHIDDIDKLKTLVSESDNVEINQIVYETGHRKLDGRNLSIHHDDVLEFTSIFFNKEKFVKILQNKFPIILIDEYQDTNKIIVNAIEENVLDAHTGPLIGFFGDHWQKIYGDGCGKIENANLISITKHSNFRSAPIIAGYLNKIRPEIKQFVSDKNVAGSIKVFHTNSWEGKRRAGSHWKNDLPQENVHEYLNDVKAILSNGDWDFTNGSSKILMLTHNILADEQGYGNLAKIFRYNDSFIKKENPYISFFVDSIEPMCNYYLSQNYGEMFSFIGNKFPKISSLQAKQEWKNSLDKLITLRENNTIEDVINHIKSIGYPYMPDSILNLEKKYEEVREESEELDPQFEITKNIRKIDYKEIIHLTQYINEMTPFSTKHGVKGAEFDNVLIVFGRGWNHYNFDQYLEWEEIGYQESDTESYVRNRNLFYVCVSRPKKSVALFFTQLLSPNSIITLENWFGKSNIFPI